MNRVFGLDLLRALAVFFVVYNHGYPLLKDYVTEPTYTLPIFEGVAIFFVLSGFLIGRILIKTFVSEKFDAAALRTFWLRRWMRTLPNYFLVLCFLVGSYPLLGYTLPSNLAQYFFFSQSLLAPHPNFFPEAWSLAVEEWFYLCIPLPFYVLSRFHHFDRRRLLLLHIFAVIIGVTVYRTWRAHTLGFTSIEMWDASLRKPVFMRFDALMFGVLGAYASLYFQHVWARIANPALVLGLVLFLLDKALSRWPVSQDFYINYVTLSTSAIATLLLLPKLSSWRRKPDHLTRLVTWLSLVSYSMYLLNLSPVLGVIFPLWYQACPACAQVGFGSYAAYWALTLGLSYLLYQYFERPVTALRERWQPASHHIHP